MSNAEKKIYVYSDWVKENPVLVGLLCNLSRNAIERMEPASTQSF